MPEMYIIAGCNGAGKTTAAYDLLPDVFNTIEFINADEIARGLSPFNPSGVAIQAGRNAGSSGTDGRKIRKLCI